MSWFRLDDSFHHNDKISKLFEGPCPYVAIGVWTLAASMCAQQLRDGFVPAGQLKLTSAPEEAVNELVRVGLWLVVEGGYQFNDWCKYNPSSSDVREKRRAAVDRKARFRRKQSESSAPPPDTTQLTLPDSDVGQEHVPIPPSQGVERGCRLGERGMGNSGSDPLSSSEQSSCQVVELGRDHKAASIAGYRWLDSTLGGGGRAANRLAWSDEYAEIGRASDREKSLVAKHLMLSPHIVADVDKATPRHVLKFWKSLVKGPLDFAKPLQGKRYAGVGPTNKPADYAEDKAGGGCF